MAISSVDDAGGDMDYPAIIQTADKMLHLTYSWSDKSKIKHVVLDPYVLLDEQPDTLTADLNGDCEVNAADLKVFAGDWLKSASYVPVGTEPNADGLVVHYAFDETLGSVANDSSVNGYNGEVRFVSSDTPTDTAWDPCGYDANSSINFDGDVKVVVPPAAFGSIDAAITVSLWVNGDPAVQPDINWGMPFHGGNPGNDYLLYAHIPTWYGEVMFESGGYSAQRLYLEGLSPSDWEGQWNHYAFTVDSAVENKVKIFHNGELVEEGGASLGVGGIQSFHVGCGVFVVGGTTYYPYVGRLDDFRVYNYALSPDEVLYIANDGRMAVSLATNLYDDDIIDSKDFTIFALQWLKKCQ